MSKQNSHGRVHNSGSRAKNDTYLTPPGLIFAGLNKLFKDNAYERNRVKRIADFGAGIGTWGAVARWLFDAEIIGYEFDTVYQKPDWYNQYIYGDVREAANGEFDLVLMNPPFFIISDCIRKAISVLRNGGNILSLAPLSFIVPKKERRDVVDDPICPHMVFLLDPRPSFHWLYTDKKTTDVEESVLLWYRKNDRGIFSSFFYNEPLYWDYEDFGVTDMLRQHSNMQVYKEIYEDSRRRIE
jgi:hypothetical protein